MKHILVAALIALSAPVAAQDGIPSYSIEDFPIDISNEDLIELWTVSDENCRGGSLGKIDTWEACGQRAAYQIILEGRRFCHDGPTVSAHWRPCVSL